MTLWTLAALTEIKKSLDYETIEKEAQQLDYYSKRELIPELLKLRPHSMLPEAEEKIIFLKKLQKLAPSLRDAAEQEIGWLEFDFAALERELAAVYAPENLTQTEPAHAK